MDLKIAISQYLSDKKHLITNEDSMNVFNNELHSWDFANIPQPSIEELEALSQVYDAEQAVIQANKQARDYLASTDWQIIRHQDQLMSNQTPSLSEPELQTLLAQRKAARESIV
jgi:hypothetical protein